MLKWYSLIIIMTRNLDITKSQGVVTLSGTAAYEAAMLGKHAVVFSNVPFSLIEGIHRVDLFLKIYLES